MSSPPRDHHYLPKFYQKLWAGPDGKLERYTPIPSGLARKRVAPKSAGYKKDLYADPRHSPKDAAGQRLELQLFQRLDGLGALALQSMLAPTKRKISHEAKLNWVKFLRSMMHRSPTDMDATLKLYDKTWHEISGDAQVHYETHVRKRSDPDSVEEYLKNRNPNVVRDTTFDLFFDSMLAGRLVDLMCELPWSLFDLSEAHYTLLLSENPVVLVPLELPNGHIAMPLSPTKILLIAKEEGTHQEVRAMSPNRLVRVANKLTVERAYHCIIATDTKQDSFIRQHFGSARIGSISNGFNSNPSRGESI